MIFKTRSIPIRRGGCAPPQPPPAARGGAPAPPRTLSGLNKFYNVLDRQTDREIRSTFTSREQKQKIKPWFLTFLGRYKVPLRSQKLEET